MCPEKAYWNDNFRLLEMPDDLHLQKNGISVHDFWKPQKWQKLLKMCKNTRAENDPFYENPKYRIFDI